MRNTLIFDFDGTLVDSMPYWSRAQLRLLQEEGIAYPKDIIARVTPLGNTGAMHYYREQLGMKKSVAQGVARTIELSLADYRDVVPLKEGVEAFLHAAKAKGKSLNVLTASPHVTLDPCLKRLGVYGLFDNVWSCEDFGTTKSDPAIYTDVARRIGTTVDDCIFFDDNLHAVRTAMAAGMYSVGVYDLSGESFAEELRKTADGYLRSFVNAELRDA